MANMFPKNISEYMPVDSERIVYQELKNQLPDTFDVFYSVKWTTYENSQLIKSESDFIITHPDYGFLCLEVKGGSGIRIEDNIWYLEDSIYGDRKLHISPYAQAEKSMYYFTKAYINRYNIKYQGIFGAGVVFPFYPLAEDKVIDNHNRICTIDCNDLNNILEKIKQIFRMWSGSSYGRKFYSKNQHIALIELIRERIAISAAAGALVKYKEQQLNIINRVQDNYIYLLSNMRQFFIRGGAGTGKTWIAMKMAKIESQIPYHKVLFVCSSPKLAEMVKNHISPEVYVKDFRSLLFSIITNFEDYQKPMFFGISKGLKDDVVKYNAIFVDEAQDFTEEWACIIKKLLLNENESRLGVFFDDVQILREDSFGNGFGINTLPFLLRENIRNTANIYNWIADKTCLGTDMVANPIEGPTPVTESMFEHGQLTLTLETLFHKYLHDEYLSSNSIVIITDKIDSFLANYPNGIAKWSFVQREPLSDTEIRVFSIEDYKGLEADMVIYIHNSNSTLNMNYIAYTRAKYYLIELVIYY